MAKVIQKSSKSLISDAKDTCTQGIYMPAVFTSLLLGMLPQAHWVCLCCVLGTHILCCHPTGWVLGTQPEAALGGLRAASAYELVRSPTGCSRFSVTTYHIRSCPREYTGQIHPVKQWRVAASPLKKQGLFFFYPCHGIVGSQSALDCQAGFLCILAYLSNSLASFHHLKDPSTSLLPT